MKERSNMWLLLLGLVLVGSVRGRSPLGEELLVQRASSPSDLDAAASGYIYREDGNGPGTYVQLGSHSPGEYLQGKSFGGISSHPAVPSPMAYAPKAHSGFRKPYFIAPVQYQTVVHHGNDYISQGDDVPFSIHGGGAEQVVDDDQGGISYQSDVVPHDHGESGYSSDHNQGGEGYSSDYGHGGSDDSGDHDEVDVGHASDHVAGRGDHSSDHHHGGHHGHGYHKGGGSSHHADHHSSHGHKGDKGYKSHHDFSKGGKGHHGKEGAKGHYSESSGHKGSHHGGAGKFGSDHTSQKGEKGGKYGEEGHHKKGHKTTGFHNVYHKDEFKKDKTFYDDAHTGGHHNKYGGHHSDHGSKHGSHHQGGHVDAAHEEDHKGKKGHYHKGHYDDEDAGHKGKSGHESHHSHHSDYGKKGGHASSKAHGYSEKGH